MGAQKDTLQLNQFPLKILKLLTQRNMNTEINIKKDNPQETPSISTRKSKPKESLIEAAHIVKSDWIKVSDPPKGVLEGYNYGINCVVIRYSVDEIGEGPNLHVHPYPEVFHILKGRAEFTVGSKKITAEEGAIVIGPPNVPHAYKNLGPGRLDTLDIHLHEEWIQYDLAREGEKLSSTELS